MEVRDQGEDNIWIKVFFLFRLFRFPTLPPLCPPIKEEVPVPKENGVPQHNSTPNILDMSEEVR